MTKTGEIKCNLNRDKKTINYKKYINNIPKTKIKIKTKYKKLI